LLLLLRSIGGVHPEPEVQDQSRTLQAGDFFCLLFFLRSCALSLVKKNTDKKGSRTCLSDFLSLFLRMLCPRF
jgi:hypothetical protein